jgi:predicted GIY-YIG superfamily endonuclease
MTNIYVLKLKDGYWYVGKSDNISKRIQEHFDGNGSEWTKLHSPVQLDYVKKSGSPFEEDNTVKEYMLQYGIDKVRGGSYIRKELNKSEVGNLQRELKMAKNECIKCGKCDHFAKDCKIIGGTRGPKHSKGKSKQQKGNKCYRCGRSGHYNKNCYATTDKDGNDLGDSDNDDDSDDGDDSDDTNCYRCGRSGHNRQNCYAVTNINGNSLYDN